MLPKMNNKKIFNLIEYVSAALVFSFFVFHNIALVILGIFISLYAINKYYIHNLIKFSRLIEISKKKQQVYTSKEIESEKIELYKIKSGNGLAEKIEELGYIPSIIDNDEIDVA
tara:strand:+ start:107 stop:448 length:342 start_codon:yes stop_codon:yes gene_type:complete